MSDIDGRLARVLVISDDRDWSERLAALLRSEWFDVTVDTIAVRPADTAARAAADLVIVDLGLRARSAVAVCVELRARTKTPILAMGSSPEGPEVLAALAAGADSHAAVIGRPRELVARVRALLRRFPPRPRADLVIEHAPVRIDLSAREVLVAGMRVDLPVAEFELLHALLRRPGHVVTRRELVSLLPLSGGDERVLDLHVRRLRDKLEAYDKRRRITTVRGVGFRFDSDVILDVERDQGRRAGFSAVPG